MYKINCNINKIFLGSQTLNLIANFQANVGVSHIVGRNGIGKTTLLRAISGIYSYQGSCLINDTSVKDLNSVQKRQRSYCPDSYQFSELITPYQYLRFISQAYNVDIGDWIFDESESLGLRKSILTKKRINELSYGMKKKILLLSVLITGSQIILMDEPLNGLDTIGKDYLASYIRTNISNKVFIMTCHDEHWIKQFEPQTIELQ